MSPPRGPMGGGAFIVTMRGTVYVTPSPYLPIAKSRYEGLGLKVMGTTIGPSGFFTGFQKAGVKIDGGHECMIRQA